VSKSGRKDGAGHREYAAHVVFDRDRHGALAASVDRTAHPDVAVDGSGHPGGVAAISQYMEAAEVAEIAEQIRLQREGDGVVALDIDQAGSLVNDAPGEGARSDHTNSIPPRTVREGPVQVSVAVFIQIVLFGI